MIHLVNKFRITQAPKADILSGITVALALVPEAVAFSFVAGVAPLVGLYAAFIVGLITASFGGRPGMISGATGALAVVMVGLVTQHGVEYLFATVILMGILQILAGIFHLGKFIRLVPHSVMLGFVNGLAIVIFLAQLQQFKSAKPATKTLSDAPHEGGHSALDVLFNGGWMQGPELFIMLGLTFLTMAIIWGLPKITKAVPSALAAILIVSGLVIGLNIETKTVGDLAQIAGGLPSWHIPDVPLTLETLKIIFPYALILAAIGLIESLLTLTLIDEMTETRGFASQECKGQGLANVTCGFFGAMGGCAMIGQSMININAGGRGRLSGITAALTLLAFILFTGPYIEMIPLASLTGVMLMVVIATFAWGSIRILGKIPKEDALVILIVTGVTVISDLAIAVIIGVIVSALVFAWKSSRHIYCQTSITSDGSKIYNLSGPLFFGSISSFKALFDPAGDPDDVIIDFKEARVWDHSGLEAIDALASKYEAQGKKLHLVHMSEDCKLLLSKAADLVEVDSLEDPHYRVVVDYERDSTADETRD